MSWMTIHLNIWRAKKLPHMTRAALRKGMRGTAVPVCCALAYRNKGKWETSGRYPGVPCSVQQRITSTDESDMDGKPDRDIFRWKSQVSALGYQDAYWYSSAGKLYISVYRASQELNEFGSPVYNSIQRAKRAAGLSFRCMLTSGLLV